MTAIVSAEYTSTEVALRTNIHILAMALETRAAILQGHLNRDDLYWESGTAKHSWMLTANAEFHRRAPEVDTHHLGAVPNTIRYILDADDKEVMTLLTEATRA